MPEFLKKSIALRFVMLLSGVIVIGLAVLVAKQIGTFEESMRQQFEISNNIKTQLLATQVVGGLKWKKADVIDALYADLIENEGSGLVSAYVFHTDGGKLSHVQSSKFEAYDFDGFVAGHADLNGERERRFFSDAKNYIVYEPIIDIKKDEYLGGLLIAWSSQSINQTIETSKEVQVGLSFAITLTLVLLAIYLLRKMIISPLRKSIDIMTTLAEGDYNLDIPDLSRSDEIGTMARALEVFKENGLAKDEAEKAKVAATQQMQIDRKKSMDDMAGRFESEVMGIVENLLDSIKEISQKSGVLYALSSQTQSKSTEAAGFSNGASQNVQTVASASEELNCSIQEIIQQVSLSASLTQRASQEAKDTHGIVGTLQESTARIGEVVRLIQDIAEQTNLLALNATIEAARAGDAGKGFAVVANEVKTLASETARATEEISERIREIQGISDQSGAAITRIADVILQANESMTSVSAAVEEQGAATNEISRSVQEAATGTQRVSMNIEDVNKAAKETGDLVQDSNHALESLVQKSDLLKLAVNEFISDVRNS